MAGPMRGYKDYNFPAFDDAAARLRSLGHTVVSPAEIDRTLGFDGDMRVTLSRDIQEVLRCDMVAVLTGWEDSRGASAEVAVARAVGIPVRYAGEIIDA